MIFYKKFNDPGFIIIVIETVDEFFGSIEIEDDGIEQFSGEEFNLQKT